MYNIYSLYNSNDMTNYYFMQRQMVKSYLKAIDQLWQMMYRDPTHGLASLPHISSKQGDDNVDYSRQELTSTSRMATIQPPKAR